jgi:electron transfer flavoprotein alpha subunit
MRTLVVAEHDGKALRGVSLSCMTFAKAVAEASTGKASWLVIGSQIADVAAEAANYAPVLVVDSPRLAQPIAEPFARAIAAVVANGEFDLVAAASSTFAKDILPRAAGSLGGAMASDVVRHQIKDDKLLLDCPQFAGAVTATVALNGSPRFVTVRASSYAPAERSINLHGVEPIELPSATFACRGEYLGLSSKQSKRPDVTEARVVVSGGRALKSSDDFERYVGGLADVLGGAVGSSRALVDAGITPNELQVGQTGKIVAPELYIALGISGAVQHLAGMKNSRTIVAINSDPDAPIFDIADFGLVGDVYAVAPELIEKLKTHASAAPS